MTINRWVRLVLFALVVLATVPDIWSSQARATSEATPAAGGPNAVATLYDATGAPALQIQLHAIRNPNSDRQPTTRNRRTVSVEFSVSNLSPRSIATDQMRLSLVDEKSFVYEPEDDGFHQGDPADRGFDDDRIIPARRSVETVAHYEVVDAAILTRIVLTGWSTDFGSVYVPVATLHGDPPSSGAAVPLFDEFAVLIGDMTVLEVVTEPQPGAVGPAGTVLRAVRVRARNDSDLPLTIQPTSFVGVDEFGLAYRWAEGSSETWESMARYPELTGRLDIRRGQSSIERYPRFPTDPIPAGGEVDGYLFLLLPTSATIRYLVYSPGQRDYLLVPEAAAPEVPDAAGTPGLEPAVSPATPAAPLDAAPIEIPACGAAEGAATHRCLPGPGDTVVVQYGNESLLISAARVSNPSSEIVPHNRGRRMVGVELIVRNVSLSGATLDPRDLLLVDTRGFTYRPRTGLYGGPGRDEAPQLREIAPDATVSAWIYYEVAEDAQLAMIALASLRYPFGQFQMIASLGSAIEPIGVPQAIHDSTGRLVASVSVDAVDVPVDDAIEHYAISATVSIRSPGELEFDARWFWLVSSSGDTFAPTVLPTDPGSRNVRSDEWLPWESIPAGQNRSVIIVFEAPEDFELAYVLYTGAYGEEVTRLRIMAGPGGGALVSPELLTPDPAIAPTNAPNRNARGQIIESGECIGVADWVDVTIFDSTTMFARMAPASSESDEEPTAADYRAKATTFRQIAEFHRQNTTVPAGARNADEMFLALLAAYADFLDWLADEIESGADPSEIRAEPAETPPSYDAYEEAARALETALAGLSAACPGSNVHLFA